MTREIDICTIYMTPAITCQISTVTPRSKAVKPVKPSNPLIKGAKYHALWSRDKVTLSDQFPFSVFVFMYLQLISITGRDLLKTYDARSVLPLPFFLSFSFLGEFLPKSTIFLFVRSTPYKVYSIFLGDRMQYNGVYVQSLHLHVLPRFSRTPLNPTLIYNGAHAPRYHLHAWPISQGLELPAQNSGTSVCWSAGNHRLKMMH